MSVTSRSVSKGVVSIGTWLAARSVASAVVSLVLARVLGPEGYGQYVYYLAVLVFIAPIANLGASSVLTKYLAERPDDPAWRQRVVTYAAALNILGTLVIGAAMALFLMARPAGDEDTAVVFTAVIVGALLAEQVWLFEKGLLYGFHLEEQASLPAAMSAFVAAAFSVGLVMSGWGVLGGVLGVLIGGLTKAVLSGVNVLRSAKSHRLAPAASSTAPMAAPMARVAIGALLSFGLSAMMLSVISQALYRVDVILIRNLSTDKQAGLYASAVQWSEFVWIISLAVQTVMLQSTARFWVDRRLDELTALVGRLLRYVALATVLPLIVVFMFARQVLTLYFGPAYAEASVAVQILAPGVLSFALARVLGPVIQSRGNATSLVVVIGAATAANLILNWLLIPTWGAAGAAMASAISYGSVLFVYLAMLRRYGVDPFAGMSHGRLGRLLLLIVLTMGALVPIAWFVPSALIAVIAGGAVAVAVYGAGVLWLGLLSVDELRLIIQSLPVTLRRPGERIFSRLQPALLWIESGWLKKIV
jgi:O-antigen/teichoic acid export membrane protein